CTYLKRKGKLRPLGLPTILDRCRQAVVKSALEPYWEAKLRVVVTALDLDVAPTMQYREFLLLFALVQLGDGYSDADIKSAYDNIDHDFFEDCRKFSSTKLIKAWLKSGVMEEYQFTKTTVGTPQGGVISPLTFKHRSSWNGRHT
ncbi:reverse transcriptase family protein, partial [Rickettsia hoogstraalii str. RCCE3]